MTLSQASKGLSWINKCWAEIPVGCPELLAEWERSWAVDLVGIGGMDPYRFEKAS